MSTETPEAIDEAEPDTERDGDRSAFVDNVLSGTVTGHIVDPGDGEKIPATFKDLDKENQQQLAELEEQTGEDGVEADEDLLETIIEDYWVAAEDPETGETYRGDDLPSVDDVGLGFQGAVMVGFLKSVGFDNVSIREAEEFMDERLGQGNR